MNKAKPQVARPMGDMILGRVAPFMPVKLLASQQPLLLERAVKQAVLENLSEATRGFNFDTIDSQKATAQQIITAAQTLPMMASTRVVLVKDVMAMSAKELLLLQPYLQNPSPSTCLVMTCEKLDKRTKFGLWAAKQSWFSELTAPKDLATWLSREASQRNISIVPRAASRLVDLVGSDLSRLSVSLDQLALYCSGKPIELDDVDDLIAETRASSVFELTDAIGAGDARKVWRLVASLLEQKQSVPGMVALLARYARQAGLISAAYATSTKPSDLARIVGAPPFVIDKLSREWKNLSIDGAQAMTHALWQADIDSKGNSALNKVTGKHLADQIILEKALTALLAAQKSTLKQKS